MSDDLRCRLGERREGQELERMRGAAAEVLTARGPGSGEVQPDVPVGVLDAVRGFWSMSAEPVATLGSEASASASASGEHLASWVEELLARHGFHAHTHATAFLLTGLGLMPWIEFRMPRPGWFASIRRAKDPAWVFLRSDFGAVAAVSEQEYRYEFFVAHLA
ncbi:hypothetical protein [Streptomyces sp. NPDC057302]|uniref:hypothetical protein n=1 Tax=Streptomyces sp. NPDC057302 TaxID=3346094 RepID=UPI003625E91B